VGEQAQLAEVHLRQLTGFQVRHPHRGLVLTKLQVLDREAVQRAVGDHYAVPFQQTLDFCQSQTAFISVVWLEPDPDLLLVLQELLLGLARGGIPRTGLEPDRHPRRQLLARLVGPAWSPFKLGCKTQAAPDRVARPAGGPLVINSFLLYPFV